jgi:hypothetical protein
MLPPAVADPVNYQYLDYLLDDLGLTGTRTWEVGPRIDGTGNDHGDCDVVDWSLFERDTLSSQDANYLIYYQNHIQAKGYQPSLYSSPGYPTHASDVKPWVMNHPGERAQQIWASAYYLKTNYGLNINYSVIYNEPSISASILTDDIKALGTRLAAYGLTTLPQYAEAVAPQTDWTYIVPVMNDPDLWPGVGRVSYHNYGTADPYRSYLRDFAKAKDLTTAQTEMGNPTFDDLFSDLTLGGVSYWEVAYSSSLTLALSPGLTSFAPSATYFRLRQLIHYVRPGAVRIGALSSDASVRVLAFYANNSVITAIESTGSAQNVNLSGLPGGTYGVSRAVSGATSFQELGLRTVGSDGLLTLTNVTGSSGVTTLYPYSGTNHPPTIEVWGSNPGYLVAPTNTATLSVSASDPELDPLTYHWAIISQPAGASALVANPNAATTTVGGLSVAGAYAFNVAVNDGVNTSSKQVYLLAYDANPPPVLGATGFRIAAPYGLVFGLPSGTTHATIELPTSSVTLQAGISDLANTDFTGRGQWTLLSQPAGATAGVSSTTYIFVSLRATVTNMTAPGDYLFQINVTNAGHPDLVAQVLCTVHPASSAPVISAITASPPNLTLPTSALQLSALTSGSTNQPLRHWWAVKSVPAGAEPIFDHQGATNASVSNLVLPGSYTFTLRVFDDLHMTTQDKTISVSAMPGAPVIISPASASVVVGTPFTYSIVASGGPTSLNASNLPPGIMLTNGVLYGIPTTIGAYNVQLTAANVNGTGYGNLALTVKLPLPVINSAATADGLVNTPFAYAIKADNLATSFGDGGLPPGLSVDPASGAITGTPTNAGTFTATIGATNTTGSVVAPLTIVIYSGASSLPGITSALTGSGTVGLEFTYQISATNNPTSFFAIGLPAGLSFDPVRGSIFGVPLLAGNFEVTIRASNRWGAGSATLALAIAPAPPPRIDSISLSNGVVLSFQTLTNHTYTVEWNAGLLNSSWTPLTSNILGNAASQMVTDPVTNFPVRFYRLKQNAP